MNDHNVDSNECNLIYRQTTNGPARITFPRKSFVQRQPSPVLMRQVLTSNKSMPASMAVLANENCHKSQMMHHAGGGAQIINAESNNGIAAINQSGQFILVQRAGIAAGENRAAPRASSAPPAQNLVRIHFVHVNYFSFNVQFCL